MNWLRRGFTLVEIMIGTAIIGIVAAIAVPPFVQYTKTGRGMYNNQMHGVQKVDDATRYETRRMVEDTCRTMIASYKADAQQARMYEKGGQEEWAQQSKLRANRTASSYNEFVLKNSYVWSGNVPEDIKDTLPLLE